MTANDMSIVWHSSTITTTRRGALRVYSPIGTSVCNVVRNNRRSANGAILLVLLLVLLLVVRLLMMLVLLRCMVPVCLLILIGRNGRYVGAVGTMHNLLPLLIHLRRMNSHCRMGVNNMMMLVVVMLLMGRSTTT